MTGFAALPWAGTSSVRRARLSCGLRHWMSCVLIVVVVAGLGFVAPTASLQADANFARQEAIAPIAGDEQLDGLAAADVKFTTAPIEDFVVGWVQSDADF